MSHRKLDRMGLDEKICASLARHGIHTARDLLSQSLLSLMTFTDIGLEEVREVLAKVSDCIIPKHANAREILDAHEAKLTTRFLSTGILELDTAMKGGPLMGCISEVVGLPGVGKTQFCLNCCIQMSVIHRRGVMYIDTGIHTILLICSL